MLLRARPLNLKHKERYKEKRDIVLRWLLEFRISSLDLLAARIGLSPNHCTRFFKKLLERNLIERIQVNFSDKRDLVILGTEGHKLLGTEGIAHVTELTRVRRYTKKRTIDHDLEAQKAVLKIISDNVMEIVSEFNIRLEGKKPDALLFRCNPLNGDSLKVCIELEKTAKDVKNMYWVFNRYLKLIDSGVVDEVNFFFSNEEDRKDYLKYFSRDLWPETGTKVIKDKTVPTTVMKKVSSKNAARSKFVFHLLRPGEPPQLFPLSQAAKLPYYLETPRISTD